MISAFGPGTGVVLEWFGLFGGFTDPAIVPEMERDRLEYSVRPGFIRKLLVVADEAHAGTELAGGFYFFGSVGEARSFYRWSSEEHRDPDGHVFADRDYVGEGYGYVGELIGHWGGDYRDPAAAAVRMQRFALDPSVSAEALTDWWNAAVPGIAAPDHAGVSLVFDQTTCSAFLLSVTSHRSDREALDCKGLDVLQNDRIGRDLTDLAGVRRAEDIAFWVFTIWDGFAETDDAPAALFPNSPPLPAAAGWIG